MIPLPKLRTQARYGHGNQRGDEKQRRQDQDLRGLGLNGDVQQDERGDGRRRERHRRPLVSEDAVAGQNENPYDAKIGHDASCQPAALRLVTT